MIRKFRNRKISKDNQEDLKIMVKAICIDDEDAEIGESAFDHCGALKAVTLPASLRTVEENAFSRSSIKTVNYAGTRSEWNKITFGENNDKVQKARIRFN